MKEGCRRIVRSTLLDAETLLHEYENPPARAASPRKSRTFATLLRLPPGGRPGTAGTRWGGISLIEPNILKRPPWGGSDL